MQKLPDFVSAFSHHLKPLTRDGSQFTCMLFQPRIDGGIPLDSAVESQQFRSHRRSTFTFRDLWLRSTLPSSKIPRLEQSFLSKECRSREGSAWLSTTVFENHPRVAVQALCLGPTEKQIVLQE
jgi:hypothetical protein